MDLSRFPKNESITTCSLKCMYRYYSWSQPNNYNISRMVCDLWKSRKCAGDGHDLHDLTLHQNIYVKNQEEINDVMFGFRTCNLGPQVSPGSWGETVARGYLHGEGYVRRFSGSPTTVMAVPEALALRGQLRTRLASRPRTPRLW